MDRNLKNASYKCELKRLEEMKVEALNKYETNLLDESLSLFHKIDNDIDHLLEGFTGDADNTSLFKEIIFLKKTVFSYLAILYEKKGNLSESIKFDETIIQALDPYFEISYKRLLNNHIILKEFDKAEQVKNKIILYFKPELLRSFDEIFTRLDYSTNKITKTDSEKIVDKISIENSKKDQKEIIPKNKKSNMMYYLFGFLILISSVTGFYFLFRKKKFFRK